MAKSFSLSRGKTLPDTSSKSDFHDLVDQSTVTVQDLRQDEMVSGSGVVIRQAAAPSDTDALHVDTDDSYRIKVYNGSAWVEIPTISSAVQGDIIYHNGTNWVRLAAGTSGQFLKTQGSSANPTWAGVAGGVIGSYKNLKIVRTNATTVTVTADELVLEDSSNNKVTERSVSEAIAITTSGASGLDTGAEAANTIYYIWIIRKSSDGTVNGLLSTSSSSPTMPSGYDQKALVGVVGNDNSSDLIDFIQTGRYYEFTGGQTIASGNVSVWTAIDLTPSILTFFVPSALSTRVFGFLAGSAAPQLANNNSVSTDVDTGGRGKVASKAGGVTYWELDIVTTDTLYWGSGGADAEVHIGGFILNKLV